MCVCVCVCVCVSMCVCVTECLYIYHINPKFHTVVNRTNPGKHVTPRGGGGPAVRCAKSNTVMRGREKDERLTVEVDGGPVGLEIDDVSVVHVEQLLRLAMCVQQSH